MRKLIQISALAIALGTAALVPGTAQAAPSAQSGIMAENRFEDYTNSFLCNASLGIKRAAGYQTDPRSGNCHYNSFVNFWYFWYCYPAGAFCPPARES
ncbi:hypothetical protein [Nonomuraea sp. NPDC050643]|uniref:hypothetical protein n=1 Tax=Nonomuraea sp. NPDC050643 TaxID=3155660 RepID=UPI0033E6B0F3